MTIIVTILIILGVITLSIFIPYIYVYKMLKSSKDEDDNFYSRSCHK
jgi:hypothetical protein